jgi:AcrR family transcriptional regulator
MNQYPRAMAGRASSSTSPKRNATKSGGGRRKLPRAEREEQMLTVANRVFAERGFHATSMDEIAAGVGVTKPMLYAYFGSKEGLYLACVEQAGEQMLSRIIEAITGLEPPDRLEAGVKAFFSFVAERRSAWAVLYSEMAARGGPFAERIGELRGRFVQAVAHNLREGAAAVGGSLDDAEVLAIAVVGAAESLANWWVDHPELTADEMAQRLIDVTWTGLERLTGPQK